MNFPAATPAVRSEWTRRIEAEYRSSAITQQLVLWLTQLAVPRELLDDGLRIVADELDHAELSAAVCRSAGATEPPVLVREQLGIARTPENSLEQDAWGATVRYFCLGETVAVPLFRELRAECTQPTAKEALDRILRDEVRHRQFGWDLLDYFCQTDQSSVPWIDRALPGYFAQLRATYKKARGQLTVGATERDWGLMPTELYWSILQETVEREYVPRFKECGIDAVAAWKKAE
jgi:hypothetical protein